MVRKNLMISICTTTINSKYETEIFIKALYAHNPDCDFEVCLVCDNRVNDNALKYLKKLQKEYKTLKIISSTKEDSIDYLSELINYYTVKNIFPQQFIQHLRNNLGKYKEGKFCIEDRNFLWLSTGWLFNRAARQASGDILIFTPADFVYLFKLSDAERKIKNNSKNGIAYMKPNGWKRIISNSPPNVINEFMKEVKFRSLDYNQAFNYSKILRNCCYWPGSLEKTSIVDHLNEKIIWLNDKKFFTKISNCLYKDPRLVRCHHGSHFITRKAFNLIGGFTEEFYGRAFAEDKMTKMGTSLCGSKGLTRELPPEFSFCFSHSSTRIRKDLLYLDFNFMKEIPGIEKRLPIHNKRLIANNIFPLRKNTVKIFREK
jgi:hypothetical protein